MLQRYLRLLEFLDAEDDDLMEVMPTPAANKRLRVLFKELKDIESVSKALQGRDVDLLDVRQWFDELIAVKPQYERFLVPVPILCTAQISRRAACEFCAADKTA
ncbi:hypothetical protein PI124_g21407 [Phytophthora idaei]|nr:hypothetical protein PI124_g21407 [Phytophthora idaei]